MSSNVLNKIKLIGDQSKINELLEAIRCDDGVLGSIDFQKILPMPESLDIEDGSISFWAIKSYLKAVSPDTEDFGVEKFDEETFGRVIKELNELHRNHYPISVIMETDLSAPNAAEDIKQGKIYIDNFLKYGALTWYDWRTDNWGTKWNAYYCEEVYDNTIEFTTVYSKPTGIIYKLAEMFPEIRFNCAWADEPLGINVGKMAITKDWMFSIHIPEDESKEAYEMSAEILGINLEERGYYYDDEAGTYIYKR